MLDSYPSSFSPFSLLHSCSLHSAEFMIIEISKIINGSGGGKRDFAQAGGVNVDKIDDVIKYVKYYIQNNK
ncbi:MAG: hypothetical protein EOP45_21525 [Sphingobacteriaceae bacterium]|nr:MAG: hypothetical protein EOP45_21525 [Sphingobacteriaceae bacterium]